MKTTGSGLRRAYSICFVRARFHLSTWKQSQKHLRKLPDGFRGDFRQIAELGNISSTQLHLLKIPKRLAIQILSPREWWRRPLEDSNKLWP